MKGAAQTTSYDLPVGLIGPLFGPTSLFFTVLGSPPRVLASENLAALIEARRQAGLPVDIEPLAVSHLLHDGVLPSPLTIFKDINSLSMGYRADVAPDGSVSFNEIFQFDPGASRQDQRPDTSVLRAKLSQAVLNAVADARHPALMLSSGKDSLGLLIGARHAGLRNIQCLTLGEQEDDVEIQWAAHFAARLGFNHVPVVLTQHRDKVRPVLERILASSTQPSTDPALIPYAMCLGSVGLPVTDLLDGTGPDSPFGIVPSRNEIIKEYLIPSKRMPLHRLRRFVPFDNKISHLIRPKPAMHLFGGSWLTHYDTRKFYDASVDTDQRLYQLGRRQSGDAISLRTRYRGQIFDVGAAGLKVCTVAHGLNLTPHFPWTDPSLASYVYNLPASSRFDLSRGINKVLLRELLRQELDYDERILVKRGISYYKRKFVIDNLDYLLQAIRHCSLWNGNIAEFVDFLATGVRDGRPFENAILALGIISLWHECAFRQIKSDTRGSFT